MKTKSNGKTTDAELALRMASAPSFANWLCEPMAAAFICGSEGRKDLELINRDWLASESIERESTEAMARVRKRVRKVVTENVDAFVDDFGLDLAGILIR